MKRTSLLTLALFLGLASPLLAQGGHAQARQGFWIGFGLGAGSAGADCADCSDERDTGVSGYLRMGGTVRPNLLIGGETNGWSYSSDGIDQQMGFISAVAYFYPAPTSGFYLKGGLGFANYTAEDDVDELTSSGFGITGGLGYDWRVSRNFSLTPYLNYMRQVGGSLEFNGLDLDESANVNLLQIGLGFSWH